jgi:hypothetical protein
MDVIEYRVERIMDCIYNEQHAATSQTDKADNDGS